MNTTLNLNDQVLRQARTGGAGRDHPHAVR